MLSSSIEFLLNDELITINDANTNTTVLEYLRNYKNLKAQKKVVPQVIVALAQL